MLTTPVLPTLTVQRLTGTAYRTLKDALNLAASKGLVEMSPRRRIFVSAVPAADIAEVFEIRRALELLAAETLVDRITPDQLASLRAAVDRHIRRAKASLMWDREAGGAPRAHGAPLDR
jgi:DNA-binding GntR family transcriptional regulator